MQQKTLYSAMCILCAFVFTASPVLAAKKVATLVSVEYVGNIQDVEWAKNLSSPNIIGDVSPQSLSSKLFGSDPAHESMFILRASKALSLEIFTVEDIADNGKPIQGKLVGKFALPANGEYLLRHQVPEGMPNLLICAQNAATRHCWYPRFSGVDGLVEMDPGFVRYKRTQLTDPQTGKTTYF